MIFSLISAVAMAGQWLPATDLSVTPTNPATISQPAGSRLLFKFDGEQELEVWSMGRRLALISGPEETSIIPAASSPRELELRSGSVISVSNWRETSIGDAAAWNRFDRALSSWVDDGGDLPEAPRNIEYLMQQWQERRALFAQNETLWAFMPIARVELESIRHAGPSDHAEIDLEERVVNDGDTISFSVGPTVGSTSLGGFLELSVRADMESQELRRYELIAEIAGQTVLRESFSTLEHETIRGRGNVRRLIVPIPPTAEVVQVSIAGAKASITAKLQTRLPTMSEFMFRTHNRIVNGGDPLLAMEWAHATRDAYGVIRNANLLLDTQFSELANARLIEHSPDNNEAVERFEGQSPSPILVTGFAKRWYINRDVDPSQLTEFAHMLPRDPALLADLADSLPAGFFRPRGRAIRRGPAWGTGHDDQTRWSALSPESPVGVMHLDVERGGIERALFLGGTTNRVRLPTLENGRVPKLRLQADNFTSYSIDGTPYAGVGDLTVALAPGIHIIEVTSGRLLLLDGELSVDGQTFRTREVTVNGGVWELPDSGAPCDVEVMVTGGPATLLISTNLGETWEVEAPEPTSAFRFVASPWTSSFSVDVIRGPQNDASGAGIRLSAAVRRSIESSVPTIESDLQSDPLERLNQLSSLLYGVNSPAMTVALRLSRAIALGELGLSRSARMEARQAVRQEGVSAALAQAAVHIEHETTPLAHSYDHIGPATTAASAALLSEPPPSDLSGLIGLTERLSAIDAAPAHLELAEYYLSQGRVDLGWSHANLAGDAGRVLRLRAASAGTWVHLPRVDRSSGSTTIEVGRSGAGVGSSMLALAHQAMLGVDWTPSEYVVLSGDREVGTEVEQGELRIEGVCVDFSYSPQGSSCDYDVLISGQNNTISIPADSRGEWTFTVPEAGGSLTITPSVIENIGQEGGGEAEADTNSISTNSATLAIRLSHSGSVIAPQAEVQGHVVGQRGILANIAPSSLVRVRVHRGGPVTASINEHSFRVQTEAILPVSGMGLQELQVNGPANSIVSLSRLAPRPLLIESAPAVPSSRTIQSPDPTDSNAANIWLSSVSRLHEGTPTFVGNGPTYGLTLSGGFEKSGVGDFRNDYPFQSLTLSIAKRTDSNHLLGHTRLSEMSRHWIGGSVSTRRSELGHPSILGEAYWAGQSAEWQGEVIVEGGFSGGASHYSLIGEARLPKKLNNYWTLSPVLSAELGRYTERPLDEVDPRAWSPYDAAHHSGVGAALLLDWRGVRDNRLRFGATAETTPNLSPNWVESHIRFDSVLFGQTAVSLVPAVGYRFLSDWRSQAYLRPRLTGAISSTHWVGAKRTRIHVSAITQWLPLLDVVEGRLELEFNWSDRRGLRDLPPNSGPFRSALDIEVESE